MIETTGTKSGTLALVGRPNVGKSTLMNALVGEKLSIVTPKAQTTRETVTGILTTATSQTIFVDTPGLLEAKYVLQRAMHETALATLNDADAVMLLLDATRPEELPSAEVVEALRRKKSPTIVVINKIDAGTSEAVDGLADWGIRELGQEGHRISASTGAGLDELRAAIESALPEGPFYYPEDELATQPVRFFVAELVRETIFEEYGQEVPYASIVRIEEYRESEIPVFIRATIYVERESQKPILIGKKGAGIQKLGSRSREKIEAFIGQQVYLDLWIKVLPNWRAKLGTLRYLGYRLPASMAEGTEDAEPVAKPRADGSEGRQKKRGRKDTGKTGKTGKRRKGS